MLLLLVSKKGSDLRYVRSGVWRSYFTSSCNPPHWHSFHVPPLPDQAAPPSTGNQVEAMLQPSPWSSAASTTRTSTTGGPGPPYAVARAGHFPGSCQDGGCRQKGVPDQGWPGPRPSSAPPTGRRSSGATTWSGSAVRPGRPRLGPPGTLPRVNLARRLGHPPPRPTPPPP